MQFDKGDTKEKCLFLSYHWQFSKLMGEAVPLAHNLEQIGPMAYGLISNSIIYHLNSEQQNCIPVRLINN